VHGLRVCYFSASRNLLTQRIVGGRRRKIGGEEVGMFTFVTVLLILHGLVAVALMGVVSHQAFAVLFPARSSGGFVNAYRAVSAARFTNATIALYVVTFVLGAWIYPAYRVSARIWIETARLWPVSGLFEIKEQALAIGLGMLPFYWVVWRDPGDEESRTARVATTSMLCVIVWYSFIAGHVVNNVRGLFGQ
jgi:hypothetical protein